MKKSGFQSVDEYLNKQPSGTSKRLAEVRRAIRNALPEAEEVISYQIPAYKLNGKNVIFFAGWKEHYAIYPIGERVAKDLADELSVYPQSKGTIRFSLAEPVPVRLIARIAKLRGEETLARTASKKPAPKSKVKKTALRKTARKSSAGKKRR